MDTTLISNARAILRIMEKYQCSREDAHKYLDLREEGYSQTQAALMAGIADPIEDE